MKNKIVFTVVVLCLALLVLCSCGGMLNNISKAQKYAAENVSTLVCEAVVTDNDTVVYKYCKETTVMMDEVSVIITESTINSSFVLDEKTTSEDMPLNRELFNSINLNSKLVSDVKESDGVVTMKVSKDNVAAVLGANVNASTDAEVVLKMTDGVLKNITVSFGTLSGKSVTVTFNYQY